MNSPSELDWRRTETLKNLLFEVRLADVTLRIMKPGEGALIDAAIVIEESNKQRSKKLVQPMRLSYF